MTDGAHEEGEVFGFLRAGLVVDAVEHRIAMSVLPSFTKEGIEGW